MLQQTQVNRVLVKYPEFLRSFPTVRRLAKARQRDVVIAWRGMGYNNRAVRLHRLAQTVVTEYGGKFPSNFTSLISLHGIGRYTANAVLCSAFGRTVPVVDVNVRRFLSRLFWHMPSTSAMRPEVEIWTLAAMLLPKSGAYRWNQALMDFGATVCTARNPRCPDCPVRRACASHRAMTHDPFKRLRLEPSLAGTPNRIYRGRIIEELRRIHRRQIRTVRAQVLGPRIHNAFTQRHSRWLRTLLQGLKKDGLIRIHGNGSLHTQRISLA